MQNALILLCSIVIHKIPNANMLTLVDHRLEPISAVAVI